MPTIRVVFFGLISHVSKEKKKNRKNHAVLIDDHGRHRPRIHFDRDRFVDLGRGSIRFLSDGRTLRDDVNTDDASFVQYLPRLSELTDGDELKDEVHQADKTNANEAYAYVIYPGGRLEARSLYCCRARYTLEEKEYTQCVARTVLLTASVAGEKIEVRFRDVTGEWHEEEIGDQCILILNGEVEAAAELDRLRAQAKGCQEKTQPDFGQHRKIMEAKTIAECFTSRKCDSDFVPPSAPLCSWVEDVIDNYRDAFEVECANSQYP